LADGFLLRHGHSLRSGSLVLDGAQLAPLMSASHPGRHVAFPQVSGVDVIPS
jgi:hypothetical protein